MRIVPSRLQSILVTWVLGSRATAIRYELSGSEFSSDGSGPDRRWPPESRRGDGFVAEPRDMVGHSCGQTNDKLSQRRGGEGGTACRPSRATCPQRIRGRIASG